MSEPRVRSGPCAAVGPRGVLLGLLGLVLFLTPALSGNSRAAADDLPATAGPASDSSADRSRAAGVASTGARPLAPAMRFAHLEREDGLVQSSVYAVWQDPHGFIWLGTQDGLQRWDGERFETWRHEPRATSGLSSSQVHALSGDADGVWIATAVGLDRLDFATLSFDSYRYDRLDPESLAAGPVWAIEPARSGGLWVGVDGGGLYHLDGVAGTKGSGRLRSIRWRTEESSTPDDPTGASTGDSVLALSEGPDGTLWVGTRTGLGRLPEGATEIEPVPLAEITTNGERASRDPTVRALLAEEDGVWIGTYSGLHHLAFVDESSGSANTPLGAHRVWRAPNRSAVETATSEAASVDAASSAHALPNDRVRTLLRDRDGRLWVGTDAGLARWRGGDRPFDIYRHDPDWSPSLASDAILSLYQDRGGVVWVGTLGGGVDRWNPATWSFGHVVGGSPVGSGLPSQAILSFAEGPHGDLYIGTFGGGLARWRRDEGRIEVYRSDEAGSARGPSTDRIMALHVDRRGTLWIGTSGAGLDRFDAATGRFDRFRHDPADPTSLGNDAVTVLAEDPVGRLWIGLYRGGLDRFDPRTGRFEHFRHDPDDPSSLPSDTVTSLAVDGDALWVGTANAGLALFEPATRSFRSWRQRERDADGLASDAIMALHVDSSGKLWIGHQGAGLDRLERLDRRTGDAWFRNWHRRDGLSDGTVYGIREDDRGRLWMSTHDGLSIYDPEADQFDILRPRHGLQGAEFNFGAHGSTRRGEILFGGTNGFNIFRPETAERNASPPRVAILDARPLRAERSPIPPRATAEEPLEFDGASTSSIAFEFTALDFVAPEAQRYAYRLDGFDPEDQWLETDGRGQAVYTNLGAGNYVFRARATNGDGVWSQREASLPLRIRPAMWRSGWMLALYTLGALGLVWCISSIRSHDQRRRRRELEAMVALRTAEYTETVERLRASETEAESAKHRAVEALENVLEARSRAEAADRAQHKFLSAVSHELRTPLNAVLGFAQLMDLEPGLPARHQEHLQVILRSGEHLQHLIEDVLSLSKIQAEKLRLEPRVFDARRMVASVVDMVRPTADAKGLQLGSTVDPATPPRVQGDDGRITQVLVNLLGNAVKFTGAGRVSMHVRWREGVATFAVRDTGPGIPADRIERIFEPFEQNATAAREQGTGLGLAISNRLARLMDGSIEVESTPGEGSTFRFVVPLAAAHDETQREASRRPAEASTTGTRPIPEFDASGRSPASPSVPSAKVDQAAAVSAEGDVDPGTSGGRSARLGRPLPPTARVLIADDSEPNRRYLEELMGAVGVSVRLASDGAQALAVWQEFQPHLVWMDLRMPKLDGTAATAAIRNHETVHRLKHTRIVAITATSFADDREGLLESGFDAVALKPCPAEQILSLLHQQLALSTAGRDIEAPQPIPPLVDFAPSTPDAEEARDGAPPLDRAPGGTREPKGLPEARPDRPRAAAIVDPPLEASEQRSRRAARNLVLVVDDSATNRSLARALLERCGLAVDEASDGAVAVERIGRGGIDLVLMDLQMPELDGFEATRLAMARGDCPPILGVSGLVGQRERERSREVGMVDLLKKPYRLGDLEAVVERWLPTIPVGSPSAETDRTLPQVPR